MGGMQKERMNLRKGKGGGAEKTRKGDGEGRQRGEGSGGKGSWVRVEKLVTEERDCEAGRDKG
jgi:hypothetical protein